MYSHLLYWVQHEKSIEIDSPSSLCLPSFIFCSAWDNRHLLLSQAFFLLRWTMNFIKIFFAQQKDNRLTKRALKRAQLAMEALLYIHYDQIASKISRRERKSWWKDFIYSQSTFEHSCHAYIRMIKQLRGKKLAHHKKSFWRKKHGKTKSLRTNWQGKGSPG